MGKNPLNGTLLGSLDWDDPETKFPDQFIRPVLQKGASRREYDLTSFTGSFGNVSDRTPFDWYGPINELG